MIKKSFCYIVVTTFLFLLISCGMTPDKMLEDFNKGVYKDNGNGDYTTENGDPSVSTSLIERAVYAVSFNGLQRVEVSDAFVSYKWTITDNDTKVERKLSDSGSTLFIYPSVLQLKVGGDYTLRLVVKNINGLLFTDSAKLSILK